MKEGIIQNQIRLVAFKASRVEFTTHDKSSFKKLHEPKFEIQLSNLLIEESPNLFVKVFHITLETHLEVEVVKLKVDYHTVFECNNKIDTAFLDHDFARISAPAIGFPYVRSFISTITLQAGFPPIILPSINFIQFAKEHAVK